MTVVNTSISGLPENVSPGINVEFPCNDGGVTRKIKLSNLTLALTTNQPLAYNSTTALLEYQISGTPVFSISRTGAVAISDTSTTSLTSQGGALLYGRLDVRAGVGSSDHTFLVDPQGVTSIVSGGGSNITNYWYTNASGNSGVATNIKSQTIIAGAPNIYIWNGLDQVNFVGTGGTGQHVARYMQALRGSFASGGSGSNPQIWAGVSEYRDQTGKKSSLTNASISMEVDHFGNNVDDANNRQALSICIGNNTTVGGSNVPHEVSGGYNVYTAPYSQLKTMVGLGGNYQTAAIDTRYADGNSATGGVAAPTVTAASTGVTVAVSNVMPFTSDFRTRDVNSGFHATVYINGTAYTQIGYAFTSGAAGTITLSSAVTVSVGQSVRNNSKTIWFADGQQLALTTDGSGYINYDASTTNIRVWGKKLQADSGLVTYGPLSINSTANITGNTTIGGALTVNGATGTQRVIAFDTSGADRWRIIADSDTESGASGSTFRIVSFGTGYGTHNSLSIDRASGLMTMGGSVNVLASSFGAGTLQANYLAGRADLQGGTNWTGLGRNPGVSNLFVSGGVSGTPSGLASINYFGIPGDTLAAGSAPGGIANGIELDHNWGGTGYTGSRNSLLIQSSQNGVITDATMENTVASFWGWGAYNSGGTSYTSPGGYLYGTNPQVVLSPGASWWNLINAGGEYDIAAIGNNQTVTIAGTVTVGNTLSITLTSSAITGSPLTVTYTVATGNTISHIARGLTALIAQNAALVAAGVTANIQPGVAGLLTVYWPSLTTLTLAVSKSSGATETITLGTAVTNGATVRCKYGLSIIHLSNDSQAGGNGTDTAIEISGQSHAVTGSWDLGICFDGGGWSMKPTATLIVTKQPPFDGGSSLDNFLPPMLLARGIDFSQAVFSGYSLLVPGFNVSGTGATSINNGLISSTSTGLSIDVKGYVGSGNATVANGGGGGSGVIIGNYYVGDIVFDNYGGQHKVTAINTSTGAVTTLTTIVQPSTQGTLPSTTQTTSGGSGTNLTINITWGGATTLALSPSGGLTTVGGNLNLGASGSGTSTIAATNTGNMFIQSGGTSSLLRIRNSSGSPFVDFDSGNSIIKTYLPIVVGYNPVVSNGFTGPIWENVSFSGTKTDSTAILNLIQGTDTVTSTTYGLNFAEISHSFGGSSATGTRNGLLVQQSLTSTTGNTTSGTAFSALAVYAFAQANDNGTGLTAGTAKGAVWGLNTVSTLASGATYYTGLTGYELDITARSGSSVLDKQGLLIVQLTDDAVHGTRTDAAVVIGNQKSLASGAVGWNTLFNIGGPSGYWPLASSGTIMRATANASGDATLAATNGIYLPNVSFSGSAFESPGFIVDGSGNVVGASLAVSGAMTIGGAVTLPSVTFPATADSKIALYGSTYGIGVSSSELTLWTGGTLALRNGSYGGSIIFQADATGINSTAIGATTASTGAFTTLAASGNAQFFGSLDVRPSSGSSDHTFLVAPQGVTTIVSGGGTNITNYWYTNASGSSGVATNIKSQTIIAGAPNAYVWNGLDQLTFVGTGGNGQHVARYAQTLRGSYVSGGTTSNPQLWAMVAEFRDQTGVKSSLTDASLSIEVDQFGNNVDDANNRQGISLCVGNNTTVGGSNVPYEISGGYDVYTAPYSQIKTMFGAGGNYQTAVLDTRYANGNGATGGVSAPTVTANSTGTTVAVSNIMPFTSDSRARDVNSGYNATVYINGVARTQTGYAFTSGAAGTITLSAALTVTSGQSVRNNSKTIWMADGHQIAFTTDGSGYIAYDTATSNIHVYGKTLQVDSGVLTYGPVNVNGLLSTTSDFKMFGNTFTWNDNGGTTPATPTGQVTPIRIVGDTGENIKVLIDGYGASPGFAGRFANGTPSAPTACTVNNGLVNITGYGYGATGYGNTARGQFTIRASETWTDSAQGSHFTFSGTTPGGTTVSEWMRLYSGHLIIGSTTDNGTDALQVTGSATITSSATAASFMIGSSGPTLTKGTGAPSSTQPVGSIFLRTDGSVGSTLYVSRGGGTWNAVSGV